MPLLLGYQLLQTASRSKSFGQVPEVPTRCFLPTERKVLVSTYARVVLFYGKKDFFFNRPVKEWVGVCRKCVLSE